MSPLTRRGFVQGVAGAGLALSLPAVRLEFPGPASAAGSAATGYRDADYWAFADAVAPQLDRHWSTTHGYYRVPGGGETSFNADMLYVHAAAARAGHGGPARNDERARRLAARLLDDPPCRVPAGAARAAAAKAASCTARARATGDQTHDWGWGATMESTGGQHVVVDTAVVRALAMAFAARREIGLADEECEHVREHVRSAAYNTFYFFPALRLSQINWPIEIYAAAADTTGDERLLHNDCRLQLSRFARALTHPVPPWRIPFTGPGYRFHYLPQYSDGHPRNLDSAEYATIVSQAVMFYMRAREAGMPALEPGEAATIRAWLERVLCGYWTHAGYLNWDTGLSFARWHQGKKHGLCLASLTAIALAGRLQPSAAYGRWAKHMFDRALTLYERAVREDGELPPAVAFGVAATQRGEGDAELYAARIMCSAAQAAVRGLGRQPSEAPPPLYAYDPDIGRLAVTTPHYNTAILAVNRGAVPYGGMEPARLFDGDQRVAANIGGRPYASFGIVVTDHATGRRTETQRGRRVPSLADPPLRLLRAPRGTHPVRAYPRHAYAGPFEVLDAEGWTTGPTVRIRSRHRFRATYIESTWSLRPRMRRGRHSALALFPSCEGATVTVVGHDGRRRRLEQGRVDLRDVAWLELIGLAGGYVVVPRGDVPAVRAHLLRPEPQGSAPHPGPTLAIELVDGGRVPRLDLTMRYAPARDAQDAAELAGRLRRSA
ncbi:MAG TPA: hypothetical protein VFN44_23255 [Solirubrobacteraceae bacterium]|nr:hypothetical protein [Solirubrobacteraceae bacterium]